MNKLMMILLAFFSSATFAANCTQSSYDYRVDLISKKEAQLVQKAVDSLTLARDQMADAMADTGGVLKNTRALVRVYGTYMGLQTDIGSIQQQGYWLLQSIKVLKQTCPMYDQKQIEKSIHNRIASTVIVPTFSGTSIGLNIDVDLSKEL